MNLERLVLAWTAARTPRELARTLLELGRTAPRARIAVTLRTAQIAVPRSDLPAVVAELRGDGLPIAADLAWLRSQAASQGAAVSALAAQRAELATLQARREALELALAELEKGAP